MPLDFLWAVVCIDFNPLLAGNVIHTNTPTTEPLATTHRQCGEQALAALSCPFPVDQTLMSYDSSLSSGVV